MPYGEHLELEFGNPRLVHLITGKHILKYQEGTLDYSLLLGADCGFGLVGFTDSDWAVVSLTGRALQDVASAWG